MSEAAFRAALERIAALDPEKDAEESRYIYDEWGEAECFRLAQTIAREALTPEGDSL